MLAFLSMPVAFLVTTSSPVDSFVGYTSEFVGQETAEVGELVRFLADGELVRWECLPNTGDSESYGEHNENYVVSFRQPGQYTVIAAIYGNGDLAIHSQTVTVGGTVAVDPIKPLPPVGKVDPELVSKVEGWVGKYQVEKQAAAALSQSFSQVSAGIKEGTLTTPGQIITRTAELNSDIPLNEGLMAELQAYLTSRSDAGTLLTAEQHLVVWNSIALGLKNGAL